MLNFTESKLGSDFAADKLKDFKQLIDAGLSFVVLSMPGVGVSYFLRYLTTLDFALFYHIDIYSLTTLSQHEFYKLLLTELGGKPSSKTDAELLEEARKILAEAAKKHSKIVIIFSRFDQLNKQFDWNFLSNIQTLTTVDPQKICLIFTSTKPLDEIAPESLTGGNLNFYSEQIYFKPYSKEDLKKLYQIEPAKPIAKTALDNLLELSAGHNQLLHILLSSQRPNNLSLDRFVKLQMKELVDYLSYQQRKTLQKIALGKKTDEADDYLLGVGIVQDVKTKSDLVKFELFTPLLTEYIKNNLPAKLPVKEAFLFKLLKNNLGEIVSKDEIFNTVWGSSEKELENATDWALDALIYRLRKHPFMKTNSYIIESQKKVGYTLIQT